MRIPAAQSLLILASLSAGITHAELAFVQDTLLYSSIMSGGVLNLNDNDNFGESVAVLPDLDGDGVNEIAVGVPGWDNDPANFQFDAGGFWILFPQANGALNHALFVTEGLAGFPLAVPAFQHYASALVSLGDIDGDGRPELAVGAPGLDATNSPEGFVDILNLNPNGTIANARRLDSSDPALSGTFQGGDRFGRSLALIGDVDGDGLNDLAVGGPNRSSLVLVGQVWILFLQADGSVRESRVIDAVELAANGSNAFSDNSIGESLAPLGDLNGDGLLELAIADPRAVHNTAGGAGSLYLTSLNRDGSVASLVTVSKGVGGFLGDVETSDQFGGGLASLGDLDGDGLAELAVGAIHDDDGGFQTGAVWVLYFSPKGEVTQWEKISELFGDLGNVIDNSDEFGRGLALLPDQDGNGLPALLSGAALSDDGGQNRGALYRLEIGPTDPAAAFQAVGPTTGVAPFSVSFIDTSVGVGITNWAWDFGDGSTSSLQDPSHIFTTPGAHDIGLTVTSATGSSSITKTAYVCLDTSARATIRNGAGGNPLVFTPASTPVLGSTWSGDVDGFSVGATGIVVLFLYEDALEGISLSYGELLVDPSSPQVLSLASFFLGPVVTFSAPVPSDTSLIGFEASAQVFLNSNLALTNAIDLILGD